MATLKDVLIAKKMHVYEVAALADTSVATIYKMYRGEDVNLSSAIKVFDVLDITLEEYRKLDPYGRKKGKK